MNRRETVALSKRLSSILRHEAVRLRLPMSSDGYVEVDEILRLPFFRNKGYTLQHIETVVRDNDKQRFQLRYDDTSPTTSPAEISEVGGGVRIRAVQGHTITGIIDDNELLHEIRTGDEGLPEYVFHGTYMEALPSICAQGLSRMRRNHIHLATGLPTHLQPFFSFEERGSGDSEAVDLADDDAVVRGGDSRVISGMRKSCSAAIVIDLLAALRAGIRFFRANNGVILTRGLHESGILPPQFFAQVIRATTNIASREHQESASISIDESRNVSLDTNQSNQRSRGDNERHRRGTSGVSLSDPVAGTASAPSIIEDSVIQQTLGATFHEAPTYVPGTTSRNREINRGSTALRGTESIPRRVRRRGRRNSPRGSMAHGVVQN